MVTQNSSWLIECEPIYSHPFAGIHCLAILYHPKFSRKKRMIMTKLYAPFFAHTLIFRLFFDVFLPLLFSMLDDNLHMIAGDYNQASTFFLPMI